MPNRKTAQLDENPPGQRESKRIKTENDNDDDWVWDWVFTDYSGYNLFLNSPSLLNIFVFLCQLLLDNSFS